ncbi:MAG TPA: flavodoxin family protein [Victivallales bacterium]|nr:flavodoxin family protein [Victivallales bacterium]
MKVIAINGSPRKNGNTSVLIQTVFEELNREGIETEEINIGKTNFKGCIACNKCWKTRDGRCAIPDHNFNEIVDKLREADGIILGSPVYLGDVSGQMKTFMDRVSYASTGAGEIFKRKVGASIAAARRQGTIPTINTLNSFFSSSQMIIVSSNYWNFGLGMIEGEVNSDAEGLQTMRNLGKNMAWTMKSLQKANLPEPDTGFNVISKINFETININSVNR